MFGFKKSPLHKFAKHNSVDPGYPHPSGTNPFDSDDELDSKKALKPARRTSSEPVLTTQLNPNPFDDEAGKRSSSSSHFLSSERSKYKNDFCDSGGIENQSVQELENYAVYKAEENTKMVNNCLKIAEDIREDATKTLVTLHQQGEQITRTHTNAADIDHDLSRVWLFLSTNLCCLLRDGLLHEKFAKLVKKKKHFRKWWIIKWIFFKICKSVVSWACASLQICASQNEISLI